jgi:hypothetical protein
MMMHGLANPKCKLVLLYEEICTGGNLLIGGGGIYKTPIIS